MILVLIDLSDDPLDGDSVLVPHLFVVVAVVVPMLRIASSPVAVRMVAEVGLMILAAWRRSLKRAAPARVVCRCRFQTRSLTGARPSAAVDSQWFVLGLLLALVLAVVRGIERGMRTVIPATSFLLCVRTRRGSVRVSSKTPQRERLTWGGTYTVGGVSAEAIRPPSAYQSNRHTTRIESAARCPIDPQWAIFNRWNGKIIWC